MGNKKRPLPICRGRKNRGTTSVHRYFTATALRSTECIDTPCSLTGTTRHSLLYAHNVFNLQLQNVFSCLLPLLLSPTAGSLCRLKFKRIHSSTFFLHSFFKIISNFKENVKQNEETFSFFTKTYNPTGLLSIFGFQILRF